MNAQRYIQRHYERLFAMYGQSAVYRLPHPDEPAPAVLELPVTVVPCDNEAGRDAGEVTIEDRGKDFLVWAVDLVHDDELIVPHETHRIVVHTDIPWAQGHFYRPTPRTEGNAVWRWSDPQKQMVLRIHAREAAADKLTPPYEPPSVDTPPGSGGIEG